MPAPTPQLPHMASAYSNAAPTYHNHSQSPAPISYQTAPQSTGYQAITPSLPLSTPQLPAAIPQYATPRAPPSYQQPVMQQPPGGYRAPQPVEVYVLPDHANASIPADVREQFQRDEQGRVLFFTAPPANDPGFVKEEGQALGHSARYLAMRAKRDAQRAAKRKADEAGAAEREDAAKKIREEAEEQLNKDIAALRVRAIDVLGDQLAFATKSEMQALLGNGNTGALAKSLDRLADVQSDAVSKRLARDAKLEQQKAASQRPITGMTVRLEEKI
jgi:chromatin structure-remodeling complex subunit RSC1/2